MLLRISIAWEDLEISCGLPTTHGNNTTITFIRYPIKASLKESDEGGTDRTSIRNSTWTMVSRTRGNKILKDHKQEGHLRDQRTFLRLRDQYPILIPVTSSRS